MGRKELVGWVQQYFQPNFSKVEDCASGVVYCQIIDSIYAGAVPMSKVKMQAKTEVESIHNFKILQTSFSKKKIERHIDVDKLVKRSFQMNMEFVQARAPSPAPLVARARRQPRASRQSRARRQSGVPLAARGRRSPRVARRARASPHIAFRRSRSRRPRAPLSLSLSHPPRLRRRLAVHEVLLGHARAEWRGRRADAGERERAARAAARAQGGASQGGHQGRAARQGRHGRRGLPPHR